MTRRIVLIQGHPDPKGGHFGHALAAAYREGAAQAGHEVREINVATLEVPMLTSKDEWEKGPAPDALRGAQDAIGWSDHLVIFYPLWLGSMPARLKAFLEQVLRPGFAMQVAANGQWQRLLKGKSAHIVVTMGMPAFLYRWYFRAHSVKSLTRNILQFVGIAPVRTSLVGLVEGKAGRRTRWLRELQECGRKGS